MISYSSDAKVFLIKIIEVFHRFHFRICWNSNRDFNAYDEKLNYMHVHISMKNIERCCS